MVKEELESVRNANGGVLRPADVVEYAKDESTELHSKFEWNESAAAAQYRLVQARELIRIVVKVEDRDEISTRVYVSLCDDRKQKGGGYRPLDDVMRSKGMRAALLEQAKAEMIRFSMKYKQLNELALVIDAMREAIEERAPMAAG